MAIDLSEHKEGDIRPSSPHTFHIPVMGTAFSIDTPLRVARYGISSVISLVDDVLAEQMRRFHCDRLNLPFEAIGDGEEDGRARRITAYLNLIDRLVAEGGTVDHVQRPIASLAVGMDGLGDDLFAGAAFADDQNGFCTVAPGRNSGADVAKVGAVANKSLACQLAHAVPPTDDLVSVR